MNRRLAIATLALMSITTIAMAEDFVLDNININGPRFAKVRIEPKTREWLNADASKRGLRVLELDSKPYVFEGSYYHEGVDLTAEEIANIQLNHVYEKALKWVEEYNKDPNNVDVIKFAGVGFIGPVQGIGWEDKGTKPGSPVEGRRRYHKIGGEAQAYILVPTKR